jgi:hypothetical protein
MILWCGLTLSIKIVSAVNEHCIIEGCTTADSTSGNYISHNSIQSVTGHKIYSQVAVSVNILPSKLSHI